MSSEIQQIVEFIVEMDKLKAVWRKTKPFGFERYENSAEHSWQVCLLALLLTRHARQEIDIVRVFEMLVVHDIPEIDSGDQIVYKARDKDRIASERQAARRLFGLLPKEQASWCFSRWEEFETRETREAVFAYAVDRLMPVLHNIKNNGQAWRENQIPLEKVLAVNGVIEDVLPSVWEHVQGLLAELSMSGVFDFEEKKG